MHISCQHGLNILLIQKLIQLAPSSLLIEDIEGNIPIDYAVEFDQPEIFELLFKSMKIFENIEISKKLIKNTIKYGSWKTFQKMINISKI